jgi:hypothetical protein
MFRLSLSRAPKAAEKDRLTTFFDQQREVLRNDAEAAKIAPFVPSGEELIDVAAWTGLARGVLNLDEFVTRE